MQIQKFVFSPIQVNTYIMADDNGECAIIDCGCYDENEFSELRSFIDDNSFRPLKLLNTHLHLDHIFGNRFVLKEYGLRTHASMQEEKNLKSATRHAEMFGLSLPEPPDIGDYITGGQSIQVGNLNLECLFVPGHTAGSIAFYCKDEKVVFTGDALFAGSIGRTDLPGGDHRTLLNSINESLLSLPDDITVYPGHGPETKIGVERHNNPFLT